MKRPAIFSSGGTSSPVPSLRRTLGLGNKGRPDSHFKLCFQ
eukprot:CAMPEP_0204586154 /NCGR_PEP_ID=MMETSP0661-20131031/47332_1 /ASSEMBLY_ACC=CAM_ASM_000606 /TAXON_ID=109239 /ORGANISM="Alexandrium margalefi, Strain AMGDE01CS-322" /LENGTH=40 /DNA_ID= /DNA_START= /DNA_END= /DNA_ORIENTATION=